MATKRMVKPLRPFTVVSNEDPIPDTFGRAITKDKMGNPIYAKTEGQKSLVDSIYKNDIIFATGPAGSGKAQPLHSKVCTPHGWTTMGELSVGDTIIAGDGSPTIVTNIYPQGIKEIFRVTFSDGSTTECCKEHLWNVKDEYTRGDYRPYKTVQLGDIMDNLIGHDGRKNYSIPIVNPVQYNEHAVPIDPYLLGLLLGDGHLGEHVIKFTSADDTIIDSITAILESTSVMLKKCKHGKYDYNIVNSHQKGGQKNQLLESTKVLGIYNTRSDTKFIPNEYMINSIETRIAVLQGLMDSDGTVEQNGRSAYISTASQQLAHDIVSLVNSLGGTTSWREKPTKYTYKGESKIGKTAYIVTIRLPNDIPPFRIPRKLEIYKPKEKYIPIRYVTDITSVGHMDAQCISVDHPDHLYVTDDYIVTHNTFLAIAYAIKLLRRKQIDKIVLTRPPVEVGASIGFLPGDLNEKIAPFLRPFITSLDKILTKEEKERYMGKAIEIYPIGHMRGDTLENCVVILDEAQNCERTELKMFLTRMGDNSKYIITGDASQTDLKKKNMSGLEHAVSILDGIDDMIGVERLTIDDVVRHGLVKKVIQAYLEDEEQSR